MGQEGTLGGRSETGGGKSKGRSKRSRRSSPPSGADPDMEIVEIDEESNQVPGQTLVHSKDRRSSMSE